VTESIDKNSTLRVAYREVARSLSGRALDSSLLPAAVFEDLVVQRGFLDMRGHALSSYEPESLKKCAPVNEDHKMSWLAALDAFVGIFNPLPDHMPGFHANIKSFHDYVSSGDYRREKGFDKEAYIITHDFVRRHFPGAQTFNSAIRYDDEQLERAKTKHFLYSQRLEDRAPIIKMVVNDTKDPGALAHMISGAIGDDLRQDELLLYLLQIKAEMQAIGLVLPSKLLDLIDDPEKLNNFLNGSKGEGKSQLEKNLKALRDIVTSPYEKYKKRKEAIESEIRQEKHNVAQIEQSMARRHSAIRKSRTGNQTSYIKEKIEKSEQKRQRALERISALSGSLAEMSQRADSLKTINQIFSEVDTLIRPKKEPTFTVRHSSIEDLYVHYGEDLKKANRVGRQMAQYMSAPFSVHTERFQPEGVLDSAVLGGIVTNPFGYAAENPYFRRHERYGQKLDTSITILVDKSGSMAGEKIAMAYIAAERLAFWLSTASVQIEVLSFTDGDFRIYKEFSERSHPNQTKHVMAGMLSGGMSGTPTTEGTIWAHDRALQSQSKRKIVFVLTDGEPDNKTALLKLNNWIENVSPVELVGVGIMHDVSDSYERHILVSKPSDLIESVAAQVRVMMDRPQESFKRIQRPPISASATFNVCIVGEKKNKSKPQAGPTIS
jgi:hypothetical protein